MGDRRKKLKTLSLSANVLETRELGKQMARLDKQVRDEIINNESKQKIIAKNFYQRLNKSLELARSQENTTSNFRLNRRFQQSKEDDSTIMNKTDKIEEKLTKSISCHSSTLRQWNESYSVPYKKEYSLKSGVNPRPSTVLEVRCRMWQKVSEFCISGRERARSAPPWTRELRAPQHVQRAHLRALQVVGIHKSLVQPPSRQPLIDVQSLRELKEKEQTLACCAVEEFIDSLAPFKLKPGPTQEVHDINGLYYLLSTPVPPVRYSW